MPLPASAVAVRSIRSPVARRANSDATSSLGSASGIGTAPSLTGELGKTLMDERYRHRAFPNSSCAPLDRAAADVARREQSGKTRLERKGLALERPAVDPAESRVDISTGAKVARRIG